MDVLLHESYPNGDVTQINWGFHQSPLLLVALSGEGENGGRCKVIRLSDSQEPSGNRGFVRLEPQVVATLVAYKKSLFSCAWLPATTQVTLGINKGALLFDVSNGRIQRRFEAPSDVLFQQADQSGVLVHGLRGGKLCVTDIRIAGKKAVPFGSHQSPEGCPNQFYGHVNLTQMQLLNDDNYLLNSYSDGRVSSTGECLNL